ncbi:MAG TPA: hypothetical protein PKA22_06690, partial [Rhodocyclaceae bacterium]|uniref:hypothetical protein n=1 Tax=Accumulibacter sp. TaxID=2053492 RepID=UPI002CD4E838
MVTWVLRTLRRTRVDITAACRITEQTLILALAGMASGMMQQAFIVGLQDSRSSIWQLTKTQLPRHPTKKALKFLSVEVWVAPYGG